MFQLIYKHQIFQSLEDFKSPLEPHPAFLKDALQFCFQWMSAENEFIQKTSGSTGTPKEILIHRERMVASAEGTGAFFKMGEEDLLFCCLNPSYIAGKMMLVRAMVWNATIILEEPSSNPLAHYQFEKIPTFIALVPMQMEAIISHENSRELIQKIKHIILGGAPTSSSLKEKLNELGIKSYQTFGMTETVSHFALAPIKNGDLIYQTLPRVQIGTDKRGTLWVQSAMSGPEPIQTNDLVLIQSENSFQWKGRIDFVVNSGGIKLHPEVLEEKVESLLDQYFPHTPYFFSSLPDSILGEKLVLIIEGNDPTSSRKNELQEELNQVLEKYEQPKEILFRRNFVKTPSGKINRKATV